MIEDFKDVLNRRIPNIYNQFNEDIIQQAFQDGYQRFNSMLGVNDKNKKITAPSFTEYILLADNTNNIAQLHFINELDSAFEIIYKDYPQLQSQLNEIAERLIKSVNVIDVFSNMMDWQNIAIELLLIAKIWNKDIEIKGIEYPLRNGKSIDTHIKHDDLGEILCEFRSIHIDLNTSGHFGKVRKRVKYIIKKKIKDKTINLTTSSLPFPLKFLFVIQIQNGAELPQELLRKLNTIQRDESVLPIMVCRLGYLMDKITPTFQIVQIQDLINNK